MPISRNKKWALWLVSLFAVLLLVIVLSTGIGVANVSPSKIVRIVLSNVPFMNLEKDLKAMAEREKKFRIERVEVEFHGICLNCLKFNQ